MDGISKFLSCPWPVISSVDCPGNKIPQMLNDIEIRAQARPWQNIYGCIVQKVSGETYSVTGGPILHENGASGQGMVVHMGLNLGRQDLISVSLGIEVAPYIHQIKLAISWYTAPSSDWHVTAPTPLHDATRCEPLSWAPPHPYPPIWATDAKTALIAPVNPAPVAEITVAPFCGPSQACL